MNRFYLTCFLLLTFSCDLFSVSIVDSYNSISCSEFRNSAIFPGSKKGNIRSDINNNISEKKEISFTVQAINISQAELMLSFLQDAKEGNISTDRIDPILNSKGLELIIDQQNRRGKVNKDQYRELLMNLSKKTAPEILPVDDSERAKLGARRLQEEIWMVLKWGMENIDLLQKQLDSLKTLNISGQAKVIAETYLPDPLQSLPEIYFVAGGRAGFFASDNCTYMDLMVMSFSRSRRGEPYISEGEIIDYFAHEMHHVGYSYLNEKIKLVYDNEQMERALGFISGLISEGSATYLISNHRSIDSMRSNRRYARYFEMEGGLLKTCDDILHSIIEGKIKNDDDYSKATKSLLGMGSHAAGTLMMSVIDQVGGLNTILKILQDPRLFLSEYNRAAEHLNSTLMNDVHFIFNPVIVDEIKEINLLVQNYKSSIVNGIDFSEAYLMFDLLKNISDGKLDYEKIDAILFTKGMESIIRQQNNMRKVTKDQYRILLSGLINDKIPDLEPVDQSEKSKRGIEGLRNDVWPALRWALNNLDEIEQKLILLENVDFYEKALRISETYLPEPLSNTPPAFVVMGGRAGAAATGGIIYIDILKFLYFEDIGKLPPFNLKDIMNYFAHELHHIGFSQIRSKLEETLNFNFFSEKLFDIIVSLTAEGCATYLINGNSDLDYLKKINYYETYFKNLDSLLWKYENTMCQLLDREISSENEFDQAVSFMAGSAYHVTGSYIIHTINQAFGLNAIIEILKDPRKLFSLYNQSVEKLERKNSGISYFKFKNKIVKSALILGN